MRVSVTLARSRETRARAMLLLRTYTGGGMNIPDWIVQEVGDVEEFHQRRLPASLANALRAMMDRLQAESASYAPALEHLRNAERCAQNSDIRGAREHYSAALPILAEVWAVGSSSSCEE